MEMAPLTILIIKGDSMKIPKNHPRYASLRERHKLIKGYKQGLVVDAGLIAQGRGEAFDYLIGEKTIPEAKSAICYSARKLLSAKNPVISVNGNLAALVPEELVILSKLIPAKLEINLFYRNAERVRKIKKKLEELGAKVIVGRNKKIKYLHSERGFVSKTGLGSADVVLLGIEDGDRTEMMRAQGVFVIAIDLNPLSRTAQKANVTIVDNVTRALPEMIKQIKFLKKQKNHGKRMVFSFNNAQNLNKIMRKFSFRRY